MTAAVQKLLTAIDALSEPEKHDIAVEILRRSTGGNQDLVSDEELTAMALDRFSDLDKEEANGQP